MITEPTLLYLNPRDLLPSRRNVRTDPGDLAGLAETIREHGILQPLGVVCEGDTYRLIYGHRRRDAAIVAGLDRVPCIVLGAEEAEEAAVHQAIENLQRLDLNDLDQSRAFREMLEHLSRQGLSQTEALDRMARTLGLSARQIQRYLRLQDLAPGVQRFILEGEFGVTHAQHLADIAPASRQEEVAALIVEESLSAAELARLCAALQKNANIAPRVALERLRRGERIPTVEERPTEPLPTWAPPSTPEATDAPWEIESSEEEGEDNTPFLSQYKAAPWDESPAESRGFAHLEPATRDGHRVFKIHSLDAFMDELERLCRFVQEGDLQRQVEEDEGGPVKLRLAVRQLRFLVEAVTALERAFADHSTDHPLPQETT